MISLENLKILTPSQKLPQNVGDMGKLIVAKGFKKLPQSPINCPIWSHWSRPTWPGQNQEVKQALACGSQVLIPIKKFLCKFKKRLFLRIMIG